MDKVRIGIIGCGGIANSKHLPALSQLPDVELCAFCDIVEERAVKAAAEYGAPGAKVFVDYRKLLELDLDVVHVLTPNKQHSFITVDALESGKHPGELKDAVCSPGGSTIQGVRVLEEHGLRGAVMDAVLAAYDKTKEMGKG